MRSPATRGAGAAAAGGNARSTGRDADAWHVVSFQMAWRWPATCMGRVFRWRQTIGECSGDTPPKEITTLGWTSNERPAVHSRPAAHKKPPADRGQLHEIYAASVLFRLNKSRA